MLDAGQLIKLENSIEKNNTMSYAELKRKGRFIVARRTLNHYAIKKLKIRKLRN
jgi:hypothetical protein